MQEQRGVARADFQLETAGLNLRLDHCLHAAQHAEHRHCRQPHRKLPRLDFRQVEKLVDQPQQVTLIVQDPADILAVPFAQRTLNPFREQRGVPPDRSERCAQLVADHVHVPALRFVGLLRRAAGIVRLDARAVPLQQRRFGGGESLRQRFRLRLEDFLGANQLLFGALPRDENAVGGLARDLLQVPVLVVVQDRPPEIMSEARAVPRTRASIFAKAVSRLVDVSSLKGAKPQSSVVPS